MGFMLPNGNSANKRDKALKSSRRQKFNANYSEKGILDQSKHGEVENRHTKEQIDAERKRIAERHENRQWQRSIIFILAIPLVVYIIYLGLHSLIDFSLKF